MWVLYDALLSIYGSGRRVEAELGHPYIWRHLAQLVQRRFPNDPAMWLPKKPMRRHHYLYGRGTYLASPKILERIGAVHRELATAQARQTGLLDPNGAGSWTHPDLKRSLHADGKVVTPLFKAKPGEKIVNKSTGEIRHPRVEADASLHIEGTGEAAWGCKFVIVAARDTHPNSRIITDVAFVPAPGGEAARAVEMFARLHPYVPGAQAVIYDGALRGVHHQHFLRHLGLVTVSHVTAKMALRNKANKSRKRVEKRVFLESRTVPTSAGPAEIKIFTHGGQIGIGELDDTGEIAFTALQRIRTHRTRAKTGMYRWYNDYRLPPAAGGGTITIRLHGNEDDTKRRFNRTENIRPIPPGDPDFERLYPRRNDSESINRHFDDTLWLRRAHSVGHHRQTLNLLTYALGVNALTLHLHRQRQAPSRAA